MDGLADVETHRRDQVEEGEPPDIGGEGHEGCDAREHQQRHTRDHLAAAAVGPEGEGHRPQQLGNRSDEDERAERCVVDVEGVLEVAADDRDPAAECAGHDGGSGEQHEWGEPVLAKDPDQRRRFPFLSGAGHDGQVGDVLLAAGLCHDCLQELVGNGEVEHHPVGHRREPYPQTLLGRGCGARGLRQRCVPEG